MAGVQARNGEASPRKGFRFGSIGGAIVLLVLGATFGYSLAISRADTTEEELAQTKLELSTLSLAHDTLQERNWLLYEENERLETELTDAATVASATGGAVSEDAGFITDGLYVVGRDIEPGTYDGQVSGEFGYWARLKSTSGMVSSIVTNDLVRGPFVLEVRPSDTAIELRGVAITFVE